MALKSVLKAQKRIRNTRSEFAEYSSPWHRKGGWCRYEKRMHARALRTLGRGLIKEELAAEDLWYKVPVPKGSKRPETRRRRSERFSAWWDILSIRYGAPFEVVARDGSHLSSYRRRRLESYEVLCRLRRTRYWKKHIV